MTWHMRQRGGTSGVISNKPSMLTLCAVVAEGRASQGAAEGSSGSEGVAVHTLEPEMLISWGPFLC